MPEELVTQFKETYNDSPAGKIAIVTMDNGEDYRKPNSFGLGGHNATIILGRYDGT